jgi:hypothetical protein
LIGIVEFSSRVVDPRNINLPRSERSRSTIFLKLSGG